MDFDRAIEYALDGEAVLFTGAGFSLGATNLRGTAVKTGPALATHLSELCQIPSDSPLEDAAEEFADRYGDDRLIEELHQEFLVKNIAKSHQIIAKLPWKQVYTTNYDNVLETAYSRSSRKLIPVTLSDDITKIGKKGDICVHFNGYAQHIDRDNIWSEIKLTDTSYLTASIAQSPWAVSFRQDLSIARAVFFVGYSAYDLDIRRLLFEDPSLKEKCFFVIGKSPHAITERRASRFGKVIRKNTDDFATYLDHKKKTYIPPRVKPFLGYCIEKFEIPQEYGNITDQSIFDLIMLGKSDIRFIWNSMNAEIMYFCERDASEKLMQYLSSGERALVIHSELGNGKSLFLEAMKCRAIENGYDVYVVAKRNGDILSEMDQILHSEKKILLVIDDYPAQLDVIRYFNTHANNISALVLSARTPTHEVLVDSLCSALSVSDIPEISVNSLSPVEIKWLCNFLNEYGLWGDKAAWPKDRKIAFIDESCKGEFHAVLLKLFESPQILLRFDRLFSQLMEQKDYYEITIGILSLTVLNYLPNLNILIDLWGDRVLGSQFRRNLNIKQLIDFKHGSISFRSSPYNDT